MTAARKALYILVIVVGALRMIGWTVGSDTLRGIGAVTAASPLPIVFTEVKGVETFASEVHLVYTDARGAEQRVHVTPALYSQVKGPYNRRNVYGAAIAYGPIMPEALWRSVLLHGLCSGDLHNELGLPEGIRDVRFELRTRTAGRNDAWVLAPGACP